jgi:hypothetical protein
MGGGKGKQEYTIGYRYYASVHMVLCHGGATIRKFYCGDKEIGMTSMESNGKGYFDHYNLFGGEDAEGGIRGTTWTFTDSIPSELLTYYSRILGKTPPGYKGVLNFFLHNFMVCAVNPYPKPWRFAVTRIPDVSNLTNTEKIINSNQANPAAIITECLENTEWGLGISQGDIDYTSFKNAANTLRVEGFGLCIRWDQTMSLEDFISEICQIIDGQLQMDPVSGKFALKLIRQDYNVDTLLSLGPSEILELADFSRPDPKDIINEVVIVFEDVTTGIQQSITEQNTAALAQNPSRNSIQLTYLGIPTQSLARRVALRELAQYASGLASCVLVANRKAANLKMGDCFKLNWPPLGIEQMIMRVTNFQQGMSTDWRVRIECVQDIYGMPDTTFTDSETEWKEPDYTPVSASVTTIYELPYFLVNYFILGDRSSQLADQPEGYGYFTALAGQSSGTSLGYEVFLQDSYNQWQSERKLAFCEYGLLDNDIDDIATSFQITELSFFGVEANEPCLLGNEWVIIQSYNSGTRTLTVSRGAMDTLPVVHSMGERIWFPGYYSNFIPRVYVSGQTAVARLSTFSKMGSIAVASSPQLSYNFKNRASRPIPPGQIKINNVYRPKVLDSFATEIKWARRDRLDTIRPSINTDNDFLPEPGTTYTVTIREKLFPTTTNWAQISNTTNIDIVTMSNPTTFSLAGKYTGNAYALEITIFAVLNGLESWQKDVISFTHTPWVPEIVGFGTAPTSPTNGTAFVGDASSGRLNQIGIYKGSWQYYTPTSGQQVHDTNGIHTFDGTNWD